MSYCISYGSDKNLIRFHRKDYRGIILLSFVTALIIGVRVFLPGVIDSFLDILNPLDEYGMQAFSVMMDQVYQGMPVGEAVDAFCNSIIEHANIGY